MQPAIRIVLLTKLLKQKIEMLEDSFLRIANEAPVMLWVADQHQNFIFFNSSWLNFRGATLECEKAGNWIEDIHNKDVCRVNTQLEKHFKNQKAYKLEYRLKRHDGTYRWILENGTPRFNDEGFRGFIGSCVDIHEIKELESRKEKFITAASHELRTPLTTLNVYLHLIDDYFKQQKITDFRTYTSGAIQQLNKVNNLIEQLLDLNKIQSGALSYDFKEIPFGAIVATTVEKMRMLHPSRKILLKGASRSVIPGDAEKLSQAIENILNNSIKFSEEDSAIELKLAEDKKNVFLEIKDFGIGIAKEYLPRIFEKFFRIPGAKEETYPGLGMGLYLTQKIIKKHNGKINVDSVENDYTKFSIQIPLI